MAQFLVTLRTDEHTAHIVAAFRRYVGAAEVVDDVLKLQVRTSTLRTALRIEQVRVVALRAEVLLEQEAVNAQCSELHHSIDEHEHLVEMEEAHTVIVLEDWVDISQRRFLQQSVSHDSLVS